MLKHFIIFFSIILLGIVVIHYLPTPTKKDIGNKINEFKQEFSDSIKGRDYQLQINKQGTFIFDGDRAVGFIAAEDTCSCSLHDIIVKDNL